MSDAPAKNERRGAYCPHCGGSGIIYPPESHPLMCPRCGAHLTVGDVTLLVEGSDSSEVLNVAQSLAEKVVMGRKMSKNKSPWVSGSFYLAGAVTIGTLLLLMANTVSAIVLPFVIVGTLLLVSVIGALQLRQDAALSQKNFLSLMLMVFRQIPFLRNRESDDSTK